MLILEPIEQPFVLQPVRRKCEVRDILGVARRTTKVVITEARRCEKRLSYLHIRVRQDIYLLLDIRVLRLRLR